MEELRFKKNDLTLYYAGLPNFKRNFTRDSIISALLIKDMEMLKNQLIFSSINQGKKINPINGEEIGKIHHEYPGVELRKYNTKYNSCDTTALYLLGHYYYYKNTKNNTLLKKYKKNIYLAIKYILNHLNNKNLFIEDPNFSNAKKYALKVTYWKDSAVINRENFEPEYPVIYPLVHIQNTIALRKISTILKDENLKNKAKLMTKAFKKLYNPKTKLLYLAIDKLGPINAINSDILHSLFYLEKKDLNYIKILKIKKYAKKLETDAGYKNLDLTAKIKINDQYHTNSIWPFEQAIINIGAKKFKLKKIEKKTLNIIKYLKENYEIIKIEENKLVNSGCNPQLWTWAAKKYFKKTYSFNH